MEAAKKPSKSQSTPIYRRGTKVYFYGCAPFMLAGLTGVVTAVDGDLLRIKCGGLTVELPTHYFKPEVATARRRVEAKAA